MCKVRLANGSPKVTVDLVGRNVTLSKRDLETLPITSGWTFPSGHGKGTFGAVPTVGRLIEVDFFPRNSNKAVCY